ncbi:MAG: amino acid adenylation domain-containing protein [Rhodococcus sp.]|nr:amino acid adenylation domain-containing protein [Rhodococcus sp. (in: high G+C Gram-positive bacteria)]
MRYATPIQRRLVLAAKLRPSDPSPNWALLSRLPAGTDAPRFAAAVEDVLGRSGAFTEIFELTPSGDVTVSASDVRAAVKVVTYPDLGAIQDEVARLGDAVYDPSTAPLYHAEIGVVGDDAYFMFAGAHVLSDGFGFYNLIADFAARYADPAYVSPDTASPADTLEPYTRSREEVVEYFSGLFSGVDSFQIDGWDRRDELGRIPGAITRSLLPAAEYNAAGDVARGLGVRRYTVLLTTMAMTVGALSGVDTVVISTPMSNRRSGDASQSTRGVRVNALPVRFDLAGDDSFADLCRRTDRQLARLIEFEQHAFSDYSRSVVGSESMDSTQPSVAFTLYPRPLAAAADGERGEPVNVDRRYLQYPLTINVEVSDADATLIVERADYLPDCDVAQVYRHVLAQAIEARGAVRLGDVEWAHGEHAARVDIETTFPSRTMGGAFAAAVAAHPDRTAVVEDDVQVTFGELDVMSSSIAAWVDENVPGDMVGVTMPPSVQWLATVLALFKTGKVYVPIDAAAASARITQIVRECPDISVLTSAGQTLDSADVTTIPFPESLPERAFTGSSPGPEDTAYVIFTSGTTGSPKGVRIAHRSAARFFDGLFAATEIQASKWLLFHSISFDISLVESFGALLGGGTVCIPRREVKRDPARLAEFIERHDVEIVSQTPSAFAMLSGRLRRARSVRHVLFCGERLEFATLADFARDRPDVALSNCYGITETTMYHTAFRVPGDPKQVPSESVVGRPFADMGMAVVDAQLRVLPRGVSGQLVVTGAGLMQGYLNSEELTAQRVRDIDGVPTYLTGDRGFLDAEGRFVVLGRVDNQVKIRGHRCELGEIEHALIATEQVERAHATVIGSGLTAELACFVVLSPGGSVQGVRERVRTLLPRYFEPDRLVALDELPVDSNGKVDSAALRAGVAADAAAIPSVDTDSDRAGDVDVAAVVEQVWTEVLGTSDFDGSTRFFDVGGTSAMVLQMGEQLRMRLGVTDLDVVDLFEHSTPNTLSEFLSGKV